MPCILQSAPQVPRVLACTLLTTVFCMCDVNITQTSVYGWCGCRPSRNVSVIDSSTNVKRGHAPVTIHHALTINPHDISLFAFQPEQGNANTQKIRWVVLAMAALRPGTSTDPCLLAGICSVSLPGAVKRDGLSLSGNSTRRSGNGRLFLRWATNSSCEGSDLGALSSWPAAQWMSETVFLAAVGVRGRGRL
jgi:hypothetical protein